MVLTVLRYSLSFSCSGPVVNHYSVILNIWPGSLERWISLSTEQITVQRIARFALLTLVHWKAIYPVNSVIQPSNNCGQKVTTLDRHCRIWQSFPIAIIGKSLLSGCYNFPEEGGSSRQLKGNTVISSSFLQQRADPRNISFRKPVRWLIYLYQRQVQIYRSRGFT